MKPKKILVLNGPNLDMLGMREPEVYGTETLGNLEYEVQRYGEKHGVEVTCYQSNSEGKLINKIHGAVGKYDGIVYNPGAHTHYSYALRDAVAAIDVPVVEVHLSDINSREPFRRVSVIAPVCIAQVKGMGFKGYCRAIDILRESAGASRLGEAAGRQAPESLVPEVSLDGAASVSAERFARLRAACAQFGISELLVRDTSNIQWLTVFDDVFDEEKAHALLVSGDSARLHTDSRYANAVHTVAKEIGSTIEVDDVRKSHAQFAHDALTQLGASAFGGKLGFEDSVSYAEFVKMVEAFGADHLAPTTDIVRSLRAVKDSNEIARLKAAQAVTDAAFLHIIDFMKPGMTEREVQLELEHFMVAHGAEGLAFSSVVATGQNGADPHAIPGDTRLEAGQCVVMDFGARAYGYCSDMTRTVFLGNPEGEMAAAWETLRNANEAVQSALRPGMTGAEAHQLAEGVLAEGGFGGRMGHGLGHGVGLDVHELPSLNPANCAPLIEGNVVTVEPGIYLPGKFGMRLEDFGVITTSGFDVFTQSTHETVII